MSIKISYMLYRKIPFIPFISINISQVTYKILYITYYISYILYKISYILYKISHTINSKMARSKPFYVLLCKIDI